jgi:hypothetical protein
MKTLAIDIVSYVVSFVGTFFFYAFYQLYKLPYSAYCAARHAGHVSICKECQKQLLRGTNGNDHHYP